MATVVLWGGAAVVVVLVLLLKDKYYSINSKSSGYSVSNVSSWSSKGMWISLPEEDGEDRDLLFTARDLFFKKKIGRVQHGTLAMKEVEDNIKIIFCNVIRLCLINIHSGHTYDE